MKRFTAILLSLILVVFLPSCKQKNGGEEGADTKDKFYLSDKRFSDESLLSFTHSDGTYTMEPGHFVCILPDGNGEASDFSPDIDYSKKFQKLVTPYGITVGDSIDDLIKKTELETSFAAYVEKGSSFKEFDKEKGFELSGDSGGCIYFGFARDKEAGGKWAFAEYSMLTKILQGKLIADTEKQEFDFILSYAIFDADKKIQQFVTIYGDINMVISLITAK